MSEIIQANPPIFMTFSVLLLCELCCLIMLLIVKLQIRHDLFCLIWNCRSDLKRLDFQGFYTVLLTKDDDLISVATVR